MADLAALARRTAVRLLLTGQAVIVLPEPFNAREVRMAALGDADRRAVLAAYGAEHIHELSSTFQTPYELSLAAACASELRQPVTRSHLFDAFVRRNLVGLESPAQTRAALRRVALACFSLGIQGLAAVGSELPQLPRPESDDQAAWRRYAEIIYSIYRPRFTGQELATQRAAAWRELLGPLSTAAVDPLYRSNDAWSLKFGDGDADSARHIREQFPDQVRQLFVQALDEPGRLTSIFGAWNERVRRTALAIDVLGMVGSEATINRLSRYVDDPELGSPALAAVKRLRGKRAT